MYLHKSRFTTWSSALTPDGRRVAFIGRHHTILVFDVIDKGDSEMVLEGPLVLAGHADYIRNMAFSRDGRFLASTSFDQMRIWNLKAAAENKQAPISDPELANFTDETNYTAIDKNGWLTCTSMAAGLPSRIPEVHRNTLLRPSNVFVLGHQKQTRLHLESFVHGKDWVKCKT